MVPSTTYRDSWGLALALQAQTGGGGSFRVCFGVSVTACWGSCCEPSRESRSTASASASGSTSQHCFELDHAHQLLRGGGGISIDVGEAAEAASRAVNNDAGYGSPSGERQWRLGFLTNLGVKWSNKTTHWFWYTYPCRQGQNGLLRS
jgi:hypothetical protein